MTTGNDVMPSAISEFKFCSMVLIIGAFLEAYIIGGITAEMGANMRKQNLFINEIEYVKYSMNLHKFPPHF